MFALSIIVKYKAAEPMKPARFYRDWRDQDVDTDHGWVVPMTSQGPASPHEAA